MNKDTLKTLILTALGFGIMFASLLSPKLAVGLKILQVLIIEHWDEIFSLIKKSPNLVAIIDKYKTLKASVDVSEHDAFGFLDDVFVCTPQE